MGQDINGRVRTHDAKTKLCHVSFNQHPASSPLSEAPRRDVCKQVRVNMDTNVLVRSGDILDLYRDFDRVLQALINDGWIVLKDATDTNSIERVASNQHVNHLLAGVSPQPFRQNLAILMPASRLKNSPFERFPRGETLADKKDEVLGLTCYHLFGKDNKSQWRWQYDIGGSKGDLPTAIAATGGDVIICSGWLLRQLPEPEAKTDLYVVNYYRSDHPW
ncbi:predicted protein [Histoplasma mississippiense (nom. inval.)]|uniref:Uncharacterized protein n=1 Tax=Emergomyces pasteurianus Ep9510 TaxID=1447872 RepID=A0A1J9P0I9_9EURO|nr:predicted protein [Histoplasma mississippiense (nom. inval.)]EDN09604.1 predicted protein [Histoplasma mississippiense (nom. inval.)]OJD10329.1 hypothetical protein AJ78_08618 [Emergomyces pasteurianus Ep9510]